MTKHKPMRLLPPRPRFRVPGLNLRIMDDLRGRKEVLSGPKSGKTLKIQSLTRYSGGSAVATAEELQRQVRQGSRRTGEASVDADKGAGGRSACMREVSVIIDI